MFSVSVFLFSFLLVGNWAFAQTATTTDLVSPDSLFREITADSSEEFTMCGIYRSTADVPSGYGSPFDIITNPLKLLLNVRCTDSSVAFVAGTGASDQYVYSLGYVYTHGIWQPIRLSGPASRENGTWFKGIAGGKLYVGESDMKRFKWVAAYVCSYDQEAERWKCGCRDATCTTSGWNLQMFASY